MNQFQGLEQSILRVRIAQENWRQTPLKERAKRISRFAACLVEHRKELANAILYPNRTSYLETITSELLPLAETAKWLGSNAGSILKPRRTSRLKTPMWLGSIKTRIERVPRGVILILGTWNYPIYLTGSQMLHALIAGNGLVIKPAPGCEAVTSKLAEMCILCGIPSELILVIDSSVESGKSAMEIGVDHVIMTGSSRSGRRVLEQSIGNLSSATLELSGCDSVLVLPSADLERLTKLLRFGLRINGGATCIAPRRIFVLESMFEKFTELLKQKLLQPQSPRWSTWVSPSTYEQLQPMINEALNQGASLLLDWQCDQQNPPNLPTENPASNWIATGQIVVCDVTPDMQLYGLDIFAPLMTILRVKDIDQAIEYNNRCKYGLCVSLFGQENQAESLAPRLSAGSVLVNDLVVPTADPRLPFGGRGESGFGVTRGAEGLLEMTVPQVITIRRGKWLPHSDLPHPQDEQLLDGLLQFQHGGGWTLRISGLKRLLASIRRSTNEKNAQ